MAERPGSAAEGVLAQEALGRLQAAKATHRPPQPRGGLFESVKTGAPAPAHVRMPDELLRLRIHLDRLCDRTDPCPCCRPGCIATLRRADGDDGGLFGLACVVCLRLRGYLPRAAEAELRRLYAAGRISALPVLGDSSVRG